MRKVMLEIGDITILLGENEIPLGCSRKEEAARCGSWCPFFEVVDIVQNMKGKKERFVLLTCTGSEHLLKVAE